MLFVSPIVLLVTATTPGQFVVVDQTYTHAADTTADSHFRVKPAASTPPNWRAPDNFAGGTAHMQLEVLTKPGDAPTKFQICFEAAPSYACTDQSPVYTTTGIVTWSTPVEDFFQYHRVDWTRAPHDIALILKDSKGGKPSPEKDPAEAARYFPTKLHVVVTIVAPGAKYVPPALELLPTAAANPARAAPPDAAAPPAVSAPTPAQRAARALRYPAWPSGCAGYPDAYERLSCLEAVAMDFAQLGRFAAANASLAPPAANEARVVLMGDSITAGWTASPQAKLLAGKPYVNRGISGQTTAQMLLRFRADVVALKPKVVVILAGTNDIAGNSGPATPESIQGNLASMAELAEAAGIRVVLSSLLPVTDEKKTPRGHPMMRTTERPPATLRAMNDWMAALARRRGYIYLDYFAALADAHGMLKTDLTDDGLHPNATGYALMAPLTEQAVAKALHKPVRAH